MESTGLLDLAVRRYPDCQTASSAACSPPVAGHGKLRPRPPSTAGTTAFLGASGETGGPPRTQHWPSPPMTGGGPGERAMSSSATAAAYRASDNRVLGHVELAELPVRMFLVRIQVW